MSTTHCIQMRCSRSTTIRLSYDLNNLFDRILRELQYLHEKHLHHFTLNLNKLDRISEYRDSGSYSFPVTDVELEYMFDTLGFLWLHHESPPYYTVSLREVR